MNARIPRDVGEIKTVYCRVIKKMMTIFIHLYTRPARKRAINKYLKNHKIRKLHLGCGRNIFDSWLNSDLYCDKDKISIDATKRFPFHDSAFHYIFSEHLIEHLSYSQGIGMLKECFRILKPGGKIRIATPNLEFLIELYNNEKTGLQRQYIRWATNTFLRDINTYEDTFVINNFFRDWGHRFIYDFKIMKLALEEAGFVEVRRLKVGKSGDVNFQNLESHGKVIGDKYNNLESFVVEAEKSGNR